MVSHNDIERFLVKMQVQVAEAENRKTCSNRRIAMVHPYNDILRNGVSNNIDLCGIYLK